MRAGVGTEVRVRGASPLKYGSLGDCSIRRIARANVRCGSLSFNRRLVPRLGLSFRYLLIWLMKLSLILSECERTDVISCEGCMLKKKHRERLKKRRIDNFLSRDSL